MTTIGLSMIVKNGGAGLRSCLASAKPSVDQIVVVDTGSIDDTTSIAAEFGAVTLSIPWRDNFAEARNRAIEAMTTDWVLVLDADEELEPNVTKKLSILLRNSVGVGGYCVTSRHYMPNRFVYGTSGLSHPNHDHVDRARHALSYVETSVCRLFRRLPVIRFSGRVHEKVEPQIAIAGLNLRPANFTILHFGRLTGEEDRRSKREYYRDLCRLKVQEDPQDCNGWLELGLEEYEGSHNLEEALSCLEHALALEPRLPIAWMYVSLIHLAKKHYERALETSERIPDAAGYTVLKYQIRGDALHDLGRLKEACPAYQKVHDLCRTTGLGSSSFSGIIESKLGYTQVRLGIHRAGLARLHRAVDAFPDVFENHDRLMKGYLLAGRLDQAAIIAESITRSFHSPLLYLRAAALRLQLGERANAEKTIVEALIHFPESGELNTMLCQLQTG